jgi:hypothetical protein
MVSSNKKPAVWRVSVYNVGMPTYSEIAKCVQQRFYFVPKTCWIAHVKELNGIKTRTAPNRANPRVRQVPCPADKRKPIEECMRGLGMIG